jgi:hypothetical protein
MKIKTGTLLCRIGPGSGRLNLSLVGRVCLRFRPPLPNAKPEAAAALTLRLRFGPPVESEVTYVEFSAAADVTPNVGVLEEDMVGKQDGTGCNPGRGSASGRCGWKSR